MKTVIIIEHNPEELEFLVSLFANWPCELSVLSTPDVQTAGNIMNKSMVDLVVCDLSQPGGCRLKDFSKLTRAFPLTPYITLTTAKSPTPQEAKEKGASYCFEKPVNQSEILEHAAKLLELAASETVKGIPIYSFLQMLESEEKTCILQVSRQDDIGLLYLHNGALIGAETNNLSGEEAARLILSWQESSLETRFFNGQLKRQINKPLISIIMEAFHLKNERDRQKRKAATDNKHQLPLKHLSTMGKRIPLEIGSKIKLEFPHIETQLEGVMAGMLQGNCLIIAITRPVADLQPLLGGEQRMIIKYVHKGRLWMFKSMLVQAVDTPAQLLFFEYPGVIHYHELRKAKRTAIFIPSTFHFDGKEDYYGALIDLSITGGLCQIKYKSDTPPPQMEINTSVALRCLLPGIREEQELCGRVRNMKMDKLETRVGIEFENLQPHLLDTISRYLYSIENSND
ncbi:MAG: PilZ domain-containing protein [Desulforhopalus sp.]